MSTYEYPPSDAPPVAPPAHTPPHSIEAEQAVLGTLLISERPMYALVIEEGLNPEDFFRPRHQAIFGAMLALYEQSEPIDRLTVLEHLKAKNLLEQAGGEAALDELSGPVPQAANVRQYARIVRENALLRRLLSTTSEIQLAVTSRQGDARSLVETAERMMLEVAHDDRQKEFRNIGEILDEETTKLHELSLSDTQLTGTPSGYTDLDAITGGFQPGNLIILAARPSMGKCLVGSTLIYDPMSGRRRRLDEVVGAVHRGEDAWVASVGPELRMQPAKVAGAMASGRKRVFRVTTKLGRSVVASANHPLLTMRGWKAVETLTPGARVAVPRLVPRRDVPAVMHDHEIVMLAALIADGSLTERTPRFCFGPESPVLAEVEKAAAAFGTRLRTTPGGNGTATISAGRGAPRNPVRELCEEHGIWGLLSGEKFVPDAIFGLDERQIARFLSVLYACDGHVHVSPRLRQVGYTSISERLAHDVQHLLLRLGIVGKIRTLRREVYEGTETTAREVLITGQADLGAFCELIRVVGKTDRQDRVLAGLAAAPASTNVDTLPPAIWDHVVAAKGARPWADVSQETGRARNHNWHVGTRGLSRSHLATLAHALGDEGLDRLATSELWWDEIVSIEPAGEEETYDLDVPGFRNFVADDIVVHNSAFVTNIAENVAIQTNRAVALFSLEMGESELAQRFLASQAKIKGEELRRGRVAEHRWPKILEASNKLAQSPLFVDDSSDVSMLDIRAKSRRLHQQHGLGLIIIDYLQLLRADARIESRVQQVGEMSRGLKILARELAVPVIALSQLSRAVESRTDKKPMLSDLRESGNIEQDADLVMFLYREEYYDKETERQGLADVIIAKHRNGGLGEVELVFANEYPKFLNRAGDRHAGGPPV